MAHRRVPREVRDVRSHRSRRRRGRWHHPTSFGRRPMKYLSAAIILLVALASAAPAAQKTFCNPLNIDYAYCPIPDFVQQGKHRTAADPVIVLFRGDYYLFSTNQWGYWWSEDMLRWHFVPRKFLKPQH